MKYKVNYVNEMQLLKFDKKINEFESKGKLIKIDQYVKLSDLVGEKFYQTHFYDLSIENPLELCNPSNEDFNFVYYRLWENEKESYHLIRTHRIFSHAILRIEEIGIVKDEIFLITKNMIIDYHSSIKVAEIEIVGHKNNNEKTKRKVSLITEIIESYKNYLLGLTLEDELIWVLELKFSLYLSSDFSHWKPKNRRKHDGSFYNIDDLKKLD